MIHIYDKWYLDSDAFSFIISERSTIKDENSKNFGQEIFKNVAYCGNLYQVKNWLMNEEIRSNLELLNNLDECIKMSNSIDSGLKNAQEEIKNVAA